MNDARTQSNRDAEFDQLLECCDTIREEDHARQAYEMGKRHGRDEVPAWQPIETAPPEVKS